MGTQSVSESAVPPPQDNVASMAGGQLDAGRVILKLLQKAVGAAEANSQGALQRAEHVLHAAQNRIAELEALVEYYRDKSERAEDWLNQILTEIEDRLINEANAKRLQCRLHHKRHFELLSHSRLRLTTSGPWGDQPV